MQNSKKMVKGELWRTGMSALLLAVCWVMPAYAQEEDEGPEQPLPAEHMPLAPKSLLLDVVDIGDHYVAVGERGHILLSEDGRQWDQVDVPVRATLTSVDFADGNNGWAGGHDASIVHSNDGGKTWELQNWDPELQKPVLDVFFLDSQRGFAIGAYGLFLRTFDGGQTWTQHDDPITADEWHLNGMTRLGDGTLFMVGEAGLLARSLDEGETWEAMESPYEGSIFGVVARGEKGALMFGLRGNAFVAKDVSTATVEDWVRLNTKSVQSFMGGAKMPNGNVALVGVNGVVMVVTPENTVIRLKNPESMGLAGVVPMRDSDALLTSGEGGTYIFRQ